VVEIELVFPEVRTAFLHKTTREVELHQLRVLTRIRPNAGNSFPYPLGAPEVRVYFPGLRHDLYLPWLSGLLWLEDLQQEAIPDAVRAMLAALAPEADLRLGLPCLWREGEWNPACDLIFVARQLHRLLTDPGDYAPSDSMNPDAAIYWAGHKDRLPLEYPIPEIYGEIRKGAGGLQSRTGNRFTLMEVG
jgi:hypothetical protein